MKRLLVAGAIAGAALAACGVYHHATGARFETRMTPLGPLGYHIEIRNVGHRDSFATCRASAFNSSGKKVFTHFIGVTFPAGPFIEAGATFARDGDLPPEWVTESIEGFNARCSPIDYHGNPPI
jgi:hypothetical protein